MKFRSYEQRQVLMMPPSLEELIPPHHLVRVIDLVVEQLDLSPLYAGYSEEGQPAYHPKLLLKVLLYGYATGVRSSRKLAQELESDVCFMYLAAMQRPDFRTISDFRKTKRSFLEAYFVQVLRLCQALGLTSLGHIAIDGSKIEASAAKHRTKDRDDLLALEHRIEEEVQQLLTMAEQVDSSEDLQYGTEKHGDELPEELRDKQRFLAKLHVAEETLEDQRLNRVNITDPDARLMRTPDGSVDACYNTQLGVDSDHQIIVACDVTSHEDDHQQFVPMYEQVVQNTKRQPREVSADAGYYIGTTYLYLERNGIDAYLPDCRFDTESDDQGKEALAPFDRRNFIYQQATDTYRCPGDQALIFLSNSCRHGVKFKIYQGTTCPTCPFRNQCISKPGAPYREIHIYENDAFKAQMRANLHSPEGKQRYLKRLSTVEPVFAHLKRILGFRQFLLRGLEKVRTEFRLLCTAYNIKKLCMFLFARAA